MVKKYLNWMELHPSGRREFFNGRIVSFFLSERAKFNSLDLVVPLSWGRKRVSPSVNLLMKDGGVFRGVHGFAKK